jgi:hypothetical protein
LTAAAPAPDATFITLLKGKAAQTNKKEPKYV